MKKKVDCVFLKEVFFVLLIIATLFFAFLGVSTAITDYAESKKQRLNHVYYNCTTSNSHAFCEALKEALK